MDQEQYEYMEEVIRDDQDGLAVRNHLGADGWQEVGSEPYMESRIDPNAPQGRIYSPVRKMVRVGEKVRFQRRKQ